MRVSELLTDERIGRFFATRNHEAEVHPSVDLSNTPTVTALDISSPMAVIATQDGTLRGTSPRELNPGVHLAQGEKIVGIQSVDNIADQASQAKGFLDSEELAVFGPDCGVSSVSLRGLTHAIVEVDRTALSYSRNLFEDSPYDPKGVALLPMGEPLPIVDESLGDQTCFMVKGFVSRAGEMVRWRTDQYARWLVDLCVINTYAHNRVEMAMLRFALGETYSLRGQLETDKMIAKYLEHFDTSVRKDGDLVFTPTIEPSFGSADTNRRFPRLTSEEREVLAWQKTIAIRAEGSRDRTLLDVVRVLF